MRIAADNEIYQTPTVSDSFSQLTGQLLCGFCTVLSHASAGPPKASTPRCNAMSAARAAKVARTSLGRNTWCTSFPAVATSTDPSATATRHLNPIDS